MPLPSFKLPGAPGNASSSGSAPPGGGFGRGGITAGGTAPPGAATRGPLTGTVSRPPEAEGRGPGGTSGGPGMAQFGGTVNKGFQSSPVAMAAGGPVINNKRNFVKNLPNPKDEFTGGRMPTKQTAPAKQEYGNKARK